MMDFFAMGMLLGLSAGFSPGPLLTLVISETLRHDIRSGIKVALSPILTDMPIIVLTLSVLSQLSGRNHVLGIIALLGGVVILFMGYETMHPKPPGPGQGGLTPKSLLKGILANALSPHPYLFWFGVGGPIVSRATNQGMAAPAAFIGSFYVFLVGSKIMLAILVGRSKSFLSGTAYRYAMRFLGIALSTLALILFRDGLRLLGVIHN